MKWSIVKENWKTTKHKFQVMRFMVKACFKLMRRAWKHDFSKFSKHEAPHFAAAGDTSNIKYDSPEYKQSLKSLESALEHHYANNSHHPQHFEGGYHDMEFLDKIEMMCDWKASTRRYKGGDIKKSVKLNMERFGYSEKEMHKMENFFREINAW